MKTPHYQTRSLGIYRPRSKQKKHVLIITLSGADGSHVEMAVIFDMQPAANLKLLVFELAVPAQAGGGVLKPVNEGQTELVVRLAGEASRPIIRDLSFLPSNDWMSEISASFSRCAATLVVVTGSSRIAVALHENAMSNPTSWSFEAVRYSIRVELRVVALNRKLLTTKVLVLAREPHDPLRVCLIQAHATLAGDLPAYRELAPNYILITATVKSLDGELRSSVLDCARAEEVNNRIVSHPLTLSLVLDTGGLHMACHTTAQ